MYHCTLSGQVRPQLAVDAWGAPHWEELCSFYAGSLDAALECAQDEGWNLIGRNPKPTACEEKVYYTPYKKVVMPGRLAASTVTQFQLENSASDEGELVCEDLEG